MDEETGLYYVDPRYHDPRQSQLLGADPLWTGGDGAVDSKSLNVFIYARNNPLFFIDSSAGVAVTPGEEGIQEAVLGDFNPSALGGAEAFTSLPLAEVVGASGGESPGDESGGDAPKGKKGWNRLWKASKHLRSYLTNRKMYKAHERAAAKERAERLEELSVIPKGLVKKRLAQFEREVEFGGLVKMRLTQFERQAELRKLEERGLVKKRLAEFERKAELHGLVKQRIADIERPTELRELAKRKLVTQRLDKIRKSKGLKP
jgi:RHS repeat-associated protein